MLHGTFIGKVGTAALSLSPQALAARIIVIALILNAFVLVLAGLSVYSNRNQYYIRAEIMSRNMSAILAESVEGYIDRIDFALRVIEDAAEHESGRTDDILRKAQGLVPEALYFRIADAQGVVRQGSDGNTTAMEVTLADRDYFKTLRDRPDSGLVISLPLLGRISNQWVIILARRINTASGDFDGVAYAPLPVRRLSELFAGVDLRPNDAISLRGPLPSLGAIARFPETVGGVSAVGNQAVSAQLVSMTADHPEKGTYVARAGIDGIERVLSYHKVGAYPYYLVVGMSTGEMIDQWRAESARVIVLCLAFLAITAAGAVFAFRSLRARQILETRLTSKNQELARFAEILAHHMQEPVRQQHIFAQHLARQLPAPLPPQAQQSLDAIMGAAKRHVTMLRDAQRYLAFDGYDSSSTPLPAETALNAALDRLSPVLEERHAIIERAPLPDLPIGTAALESVFEALIENAVTYCRQDVQPCVRIGADPVNHATIVWVADNGVGIPSEFHDRVFWVFERLDPRPDQPGTGIGLPLAKKIVEAAGGRIWLEQPKEGGTRVCFSLPRAR